MDIALILTRKYPGKAWTLDDNDYASLTWLDESTKPTKKQLEDLASVVDVEIKAEEAAKAEAKAALLARIGLSEAEAKLLLA